MMNLQRAIIVDRYSILSLQRSQVMVYRTTSRRASFAPFYGLSDNNILAAD
ncbi:MAG: hypothetical protein RLZZ135_198, partial [Cyanobacteriota bacterium]